MSNFLNSIFFIKKEHLNINNVLNVLRKFMFTKINQAAIILRSRYEVMNIQPNIIAKPLAIVDSTENIAYLSISEPIVKVPVEFTNAIKDNLVNTAASEELISPKQNDTLFWCLFIIHFGYGEYLEVDRNYGVKELEVKKQIGEFITKNPHAMKSTSTKMTKAAVQEILSELLTSQKETSMNSMMAILVYYKINLIMVNSTKLLMLEFVADKDNELPTYVLHKDAYGKYSVKTEPLTTDEIADMKNKMICLESYLKPLKAISNYKVEELEELAKKMGIYEKNKKYKKNDLYQEISEACAWL
jgi:hypothetical protein